MTKVPEPPFKKQSIYSCIDGSWLSNSVCDYSCWAAKLLGSPLVLLHTIEPAQRVIDINLSGSIGLGSQEALLEELVQIEQRRSKLLTEQGNHLLGAAKARTENHGLTEVSLQQRHDNLPETLIELENEIKLLVVGIRGENHANQPLQIGNHIESIIRSLHRPTIVVTGEFKKPERIMLAYDGSEAANKALDMICKNVLLKEMCKTQACHVVFVSEQEPEVCQTILSQAKTRLDGAELNYTLNTLDSSDSISATLCQYQIDNDIDLTVMGAFSHSRLHDFFLGSLTMNMLSNTNKPLLLLR